MPAGIWTDPLPRQTLTRDQDGKVRAIFEQLSPYLKMPYERFEFGFLRDRDPDAEIGIWSQILRTHRAFLGQFPDSTADDGQDVFRCLMVISTGGDRPFTIPQPLWQAVNGFVRG